MSDNENAGSSIGNLRVLSLRLDDQLRAQLDVLAQIQQRSLTDECRIGLEHWIATSREDLRVLARAEQVRAEIEPNFPNVVTWLVVAGY